MASGPAALGTPATVLIEQLALLAALEEPHHRGTIGGELGMDRDPPADAGSGVIVQHDWKRCGRHGQTRRRTPKPRRAR